MINPGHGEPAFFYNYVNVFGVENQLFCVKKCEIDKAHYPGCHYISVLKSIYQKDWY